MNDYKPTNQFQRTTHPDIYETVKKIIKANTDEDGWIDMEKIGKEVVWLMNTKEVRSE